MSRENQEFFDRFEQLRSEIRNGFDRLEQAVNKLVDVLRR